MVTGRETVFGCAANFLRGRKCIFCGSFNVNRMIRGYVRCGVCGKQKGLTRLKREIAILAGFVEPATGLSFSADLGVDVKVVTRVYQRLRIALSQVTELEGAILAGEIELDKPYFGGRRKGQRGRGVAREKHRISPTGARWTGLYQSGRERLG